MTDRYKSRARTSAADGCGKWYIVDVVVREKILVEISDGEDEYDAKEIALDESRLFRQTECSTAKDFEVQVDIEPAANEYLEREMMCAHRVIPSNVKETDLWRCTVCGRFGTVGRCCGEETRERANMEQLLAENERLRSAIQKTLDENGHLADGENCTLIVLKRALKTPNDGIHSANEGRQME